MMFFLEVMGYYITIAVPGMGYLHTSEWLERPQGHQTTQTKATVLGHTMVTGHRNQAGAELQASSLVQLSWCQAPEQVGVGVLLTVLLSCDVARYHNDLRGRMHPLVLCRHDWK